MTSVLMNWLAFTGIMVFIRYEEKTEIYFHSEIEISDCDMLLYPAAFNMTTGPLHWELLQRARANDLQLFVATVSPGKYTFSR